MTVITLKMKLQKLLYFTYAFKQNREFLIGAFVSGDFMLRFICPTTNQRFLTKGIIFMQFHCDHPTLREFICTILFIHKENLTT